MFCIKIYFCFSFCMNDCSMRDAALLYIYYDISLVVISDDLCRQFNKHLLNRLLEECY